MARLSVALIAEAKEKASAGVDYSPRYGASCPWCGKRAKITNTTPWEDSIRLRYHRCQNTKCVLNIMNISIKSIEVDTVGKTETVRS